MIALASINDLSFRKILADFATIKAPMVVWGGAVRDLLLECYHPDKFRLNSLLNDIDIAVIIDAPVNTKELKYSQFSESYHPISILGNSLAGLIQLWGKVFDDFIQEEDATIAGIEREVSLMGLRTLYDQQGNPYPDCFAIKNGDTYNAVPICLSVNCFAIDGMGKLYGPMEYLSDFQTLTARILNPPQLNQASLPLLIRFIDYLERFSLKVEPITQEQMQSHMDDLEHRDDLIDAALSMAWTKVLLTSMFGPDIIGQPGKYIRNLIFSRCRILI